jgi:radical SAM superfamily enzyme YgiQ (UPF0313 family)
VTRRLRVLLGGVNLLDSAGQYAGEDHAEFSMTPFSVSTRPLPLGLLYIAAAQRETGQTPCEYLLYDFDQPPGEAFSLDGVYQTWRQHLRDFAPDVIAVSCLTMRQHPLLERALADARAHADGGGPGTWIIAGGPSVSKEPERFVAAGADCVAIGEGEWTFTEFIDCVAAGGSLRDVAGLAVSSAALGGSPRSDDDTVFHTGPRALTDDVDTLPMPAWDLADIPGHLKRNRGVFASLFTHRDCPYQCIYCEHIRGFRPHGPQRVVDEIEHLRTTYGARRFDIVDAVFNQDRRRVQGIRDELRRRDLRARFQNYAGLRGDILDEPTADALQQMGFTALSVAVETATPRLQELIRKRLKVDRALAAMDLLAQRGIFVNALFMVGFPTETAGEVADTLRAARDCSAHQSTLAKVEAYPGTALWDLALQHGLHTGVVDDAIERYGERTDPGYLMFPEQDLHRMWLRGLFDVYNDPARMRRIHDFVGATFFRQMYRKFYREHGVLNDSLAARFDRSRAEGLDYQATAKQAGDGLALPPLDDIVAHAALAGEGRGT